MSADSALLGPASLPRISHGRGVYLYDIDDRAYLDACSGAVVAALGHGDRELAQALAKQAEAVAFAHRSQFGGGPAEQLAERLIGIAPEGLATAFFCSSGSEAVEAAVKLAVRYWQECGRHAKTQFVSRSPSYHGSTLGALSATGHQTRRALFEPVLPQPHTDPATHRYSCPDHLDPASCGLRCLDQLEATLAAHHDHIAAVIAEPVLGAAGAVQVPPPGYYEQLRSICDSHDVLWIADEVMCGVGRTGRFFAVEHWDSVPDLVVLGKGLSAGLVPLSAVLLSERVAGAVRHSAAGPAVGHTFSNHPVAAAAGLAVLDRLERDQLVDGAAAAGERLGDLLRRSASGAVLAGNPRGIGLLWALPLVDPRTAAPPSRAGHATSVTVAACRDAGLLVYPAAGWMDGTRGDAVLLAPPLVATDADLGELARRLDLGLAAAEDLLAAQ